MGSRPRPYTSSYCKLAVSSQCFEACDLDEETLTRDRVRWLRFRRCGSTYPRGARTRRTSSSGSRPALPVGRGAGLPLSNPERCYARPMADLEHILQQLHDSEINAGVQTFYDTA